MERGGRVVRAGRVRAMRVAVLVLVPLIGCSESKPLTPAERGRRVYMTNCIVCHNPDPTQPGAQGPPIAGSSRELIEARVVHAAYPPGYTPQRTTHGMPAQPLLAGRVDDLTAFLAQAAKKTQ